MYLKKINSFGKVEIQPSQKFNRLHDYQEKAIKKLTTIFQNSNNYEGLLVLPTGAGKTYVTSYYLCKEYLDKGKKVL